MSKDGFRFVDLFAGIGGFHHALAALGGKCVMACEMDEDCRKVYLASFPTLSPQSLVGNIRTITRSEPDNENSERSLAAIARRVPDHDVLCAGFPCQPFSKSGAQRGVRDTTRGTLFFDIMSIVRAKKPRFVALENVRNLAGPRHVDTWGIIIESLRDAGYSVASQPVVLSPHLIPPEFGGAPQVRDRVFILCEHKGKASGRSLAGQALLSRNEFLDWDPDRWNISEFLDADSDIPNLEKYRVTSRERAWLDAWDYFVSHIAEDNLPGFPIWADSFGKRVRLSDDLPDWERTFLRKNSLFYTAHKSFLDSWLRRKWGPDKVTVSEFPFSRQRFEWQARKTHPNRRDRTIRDLVCQMRPSGIRVKPATYLPALVAITQTSIVGPEVTGSDTYRTLTPREAARLQGIPGNVFDSAGVSDRAAYKQLGNAVNVGVARLACRTLMYGFPMSDRDSIARSPLFAALAAC